MTPDPECRCGQDGVSWACVDGDLYGPCDDADTSNCGGACEYRGPCEHECHHQPPATSKESR